MKKACLMGLILLLTGCLRGVPGKNLQLYGTIFHENTRIPVPDALVELAVGSQIYSAVSDANGEFHILLRTNRKASRLTIRHPDYLVLNHAIDLDAPLLHGLEFKLTQGERESVLVAGRIDFALPLIAAPDQPWLKAASGFDDFQLPATSEITEIIVEPLTYKEEHARQMAFDLGAEYYRLYPNTASFVLGKPAGVAIEDFQWLASGHPLSRRVYPNNPVMPLANFWTPVEPNDPYFSNQWNLQGIYLPWAWRLTTGSNQVRIAVVDTGLDTFHGDLQSNINLTQAYNVFTKDNQVQDPGRNDPLARPSSHGTHVTGIIGAETNNNLGISGIVWQANIIPILALRDSGSTIADAIAGITKALELDVDIINLSWALNGEFAKPYDSPLYTVLQEAAARGTIVVAAAGNTGTLLYPAAYPQVIAVGATTSQHQIAPYSAYDDVDLFAPGGFGSTSLGGIYSTDLVAKSGGYSGGRGTSMAAPHVTGVVALLKAENPFLTSADAEEILWRSGIVIDPEFPQRRLLNAYAALTQSYAENAVVKFTNVADATEEYLIQVSQVSRRFFQMLPPADYLITAHIDTNHNETVDPGEWYYEQTISLCTPTPLTGWEILLQIQD